MVMEVAARFHANARLFRRTSRAAAVRQRGAGYMRARVLRHVCPCTTRLRDMNGGWPAHCRPRRQARVIPNSHEHARRCYAQRARVHSPKPACSTSGGSLSPTIAQALPAD